MKHWNCKEITRDKKVTFRLSDDERDELVKSADGHSLSDYIRWRVLEFNPERLSIRQVKQVLVHLVNDKAKREGK